MTLIFKLTATQIYSKILAWNPSCLYKRPPFRLLPHQLRVMPGSRMHGECSTNKFPRAELVRGFRDAHTLLNGAGRRR